MTKSTIERIAVLETKVEDVGKKIDEFFTESKIFHEEFIKHLDNLDDRYPTRREFKAANWVFGTILTLLSFAIALIKK